MLVTPKNAHALLIKQKHGGKTMCNLPVQIHEDSETRTSTKKAKTTKEGNLKISIYPLATFYPTATIS